jgi:coproporphyrinogen III oxidase
MSVIGSIEATHELCADLDNLIELTKESRAPIRALSFIERAREDLQAYLNAIERTSSAPRTGRARLKVKGEIGDLPMDGNIFNSQGVHVAVVVGSSIFSLRGQKLFDLKGTKIYKLSGELVGHLANASAAERHLDRATEKLFPAS